MLLFNLLELYMSNFIYNSLRYILIISFLILILNIAVNSQHVEESFVPKIVKENYRPIERNVRRSVEGFYDKSSTNISNLFRKFGII